MRFTIKKNPSDHLWEYTIYTDIQITIKDEERLTNLPISIVSPLQEALTLAHTLAVGTIIIL
jgi:hypothetical protein